MYNPVRAGTRGGQGDFKWSDVASDKDREHYLGHSLNAPVGRWQNGKDLTWYNKEGQAGEDERAAEIRKIKEAEEDALAVALGFAPTPRAPEPVPGSSTEVDPNIAIFEKAAKAREKEARKAEKEERRKGRAARREQRHKDGGSHRHHHHKSESDRRERDDDWEERRERSDYTRERDVEGGRRDVGAKGEARLERRPSYEAGRDDRSRERRFDDARRDEGRDYGRDRSRSPQRRG